MAEWSGGRSVRLGNRMKFDPLAPRYDLLETVLAGRQLDAARNAWMDELAGCRRILSVGERLWPFPAACARRWPEADMVCVEQSEQMLVRARRRGSRSFTYRCDGHRAGGVGSNAGTSWNGSRRRAIRRSRHVLLPRRFPPETLARVITKLAHCAREDAVWLNVDLTCLARLSAPARALKRSTPSCTLFSVVRVGLPARRLYTAGPFALFPRLSPRAARRIQLGTLSAEVWRRNPAGFSETQPDKMKNQSYLQ